MRQHKELYYVAGLMGVGVLLRLPNLLKLGLWRDEGSTYFDALPLEWSEVIKTVIYSELNPPAFFILMHQWMQWFGANEVVFRLPAFIFGILIIPAIYGLGCVAYSKTTGVLAAAITVFAPDAIYYSQEARPYTLTTLLCCVVMILYFKMLENPKQKLTLASFILCSTLLLYTQYTGALLILNLGMITLLLWRQKPETVQLKLFALAFGIVFILFLPWLPVFLNHISVGSPWVSKVEWIDQVGIAFKQIGYTLLIPTIGLSFTAISLIIALIISVQRWQTQPKSLFAKTNLKLRSATWILALNVVISAVAFGVLSYAASRYMLPFTPLAWVIYAHWMVDLLQVINFPWTGKLGKRNRSIAWGLLIFFLTVPSTVDAFSPGFTTKSGIRTLAADLEREPQKNHAKTLYLLSPDYFGPTFGYYFTNTKIQFHGFARWDHPELFSPRGYAEVWNSPNLISQTEQNIQIEAQNGYQKLALVLEGNTLKDSGTVRYGRANDFLAHLKKRYVLLNQKIYPGHNEKIVLYLFALSPRPLS